MTRNEIEKEIEKLFFDTTRPIEETRKDLESIADQIDTYINTLTEED